MPMVGGRIVEYDFLFFVVRVFGELVFFFME